MARAAGGDGMHGTPDDNREGDNVDPRSGEAAGVRKSPLRSGNNGTVLESLRARCSPRRKPLSGLILAEVSGHSAEESSSPSSARGPSSSRGRRLSAGRNSLGPAKGCSADVIPPNNSRTSPEAAAGDALLEGFCRGVALCEDVIRCSLSGGQDSRILAELAALTKEVQCNGSSAPELAALLHKVSGRPRDGTSTSPASRGVETVGALLSGQLLDERCKQELEKHVVDARAARSEAHMLRAELQELQHRLASVDAVASNVGAITALKEVTCLRAELGERDRHILKLEADLSRAYAQLRRQPPLSTDGMHAPSDSASASGRLLMRARTNSMPEGPSVSIPSDAEWHGSSLSSAVEVPRLDMERVAGNLHVTSVTPGESGGRMHLSNLKAGLSFSQVQRSISTASSNTGAGSTLLPSPSSARLVDPSTVEVIWTGQPYRTSTDDQMGILAPPMPTQLPADENVSVQSGRVKGSYIHAAGGKVYWLNHDDPLDLQRLPDEAAAAARLADGLRKRITGPHEAKIIGGTPPAGIADTRIDQPQREEPLLPETPDPNRDKVSRLRSAPSTGSLDYRASIDSRLGTPLARTFSGSQTLPTASPRTVEQEIAAVASWSGLFCDPSLGQTVTVQPPADCDHMVARRNLSEPRLRRPGNQRGGSVVASSSSASSANNSSAAVLGQASACGGGLGMPLTSSGALTHRAQGTYSPSPWSPAPQPLSARPPSRNGGERPSSLASGRTKLSTVSYGANSARRDGRLVGHDIHRSSSPSSGPNYQRQNRPQNLLRSVSASVTAPPGPTVHALAQGASPVTLPSPSRAAANHWPVAAMT